METAILSCMVCYFFAGQSLLYFPLYFPLLSSPFLYFPFLYFPFLYFPLLYFPLLDFLLLDFPLLYSFIPFFLSFFLLLSPPKLNSQTGLAGTITYEYLSPFLFPILQTTFSQKKKKEEEDEEEGEGQYKREEKLEVEMKKMGGMEGERGIEGEIECEIEEMDTNNYYSFSQEESYTFFIIFVCSGIGAAIGFFSFFLFSFSFPLSFALRFILHSFPSSKRRFSLTSCV